MEEYYTVPEIAALFHVEDISVRDWINSGRLQATKIGRQWRVPAAELQAFVNADANEAEWRERQKGADSEQVDSRVKYSQSHPSVSI